MSYKINFKVIIKIVGIPGLIALGGILAFVGHSLNNGASIYGWVLIGIGFFIWFTTSLLIPIFKKKKVI